MNRYEYFVLSQQPEFADVLTWIGQYPLLYECHLNRTRFWVPEGPIYTEFMLRWGYCCHRVEAD